MRTRNAAILVAIFALVMFLAQGYPILHAQGPPPLPMLFTGNVTLNGAPAGDGLNVTALDNGLVVGSTLTSGGQYTVQVCGQLDQACNGGETISFKLNGQLTASQTATFDSSLRGIPQTLELTFTGTLQQITTTMTTSTTSSTTSSTTVESSTSESTTTTTSTSSSVTSTSSSESSSTGSTESSSSQTTASVATSSSTSYPTGPTCLIATATYGSELAPEVQLLRNFRDHSIMKTQAGSQFMIAFNAWYYSFSPYVANYIANHLVERTVMKGVLYPLIGILYLSQEVFSIAGSYPEVAALLSGLVASSLIGAIYLGLPMGLLRRKLLPTPNRRLDRFLTRSLALTLLVGSIALIVGETAGLSLLLIFSSAAIVLSTLLFSAVRTSAKISEISR